MSSTFNFSLVPWGERSFALTSSASAPLTGWVRIVCPQGNKVNASVRFAVGGPGGTVADAVGILPAYPAGFWSITLDRRTANDFLGVAVVNPAADAGATVSFDLWQGGNRVPGTARVTRPLSARGHLAIFLHQLYPNVTSDGAVTLEVRADVSISVVAIRADGTQFSSLPGTYAAYVYDYTVTDNGGQTYRSGRWVIQLVNFWDFSGIGKELGQTWDLRGTWLQNARFFVNWGYHPAQGGRQVIACYGTWRTDDTISGKYLEISEDGSIARTYNFRATGAQ